MQDLIKKFRFRDKPVVINVPPGLKKDFDAVPAFDKKKKSSNTLVFVNDRKELLNFLSNDLGNVEPDSILWMAYPKGSSKIKTDINRDTIRVTAEEYQITTVAAISIDDTWSALRFRPIEKVGT